jgi:peptide-methionine (S)-S-oxide reductase
MTSASDHPPAASKQAAGEGQPSADSPRAAAEGPRGPTSSAVELATFGAGCYWCVEAVFQQLDGVISVVSGFSGGTVKDPTYEQVCSGTTGHAEVCQIEFDPAKISFDELLEVFWQTHDPTTLNRQGADEGTQYRSVVFYHNEAQQRAAEQRKEQLDAAGIFPSPIVTEISPFGEFYKAKAEHQDFYRQNPNYGYCQVVIRPKVDKFRKVFAEKLKAEERGGLP